MAASIGGTVAPVLLGRWFEYVRLVGLPWQAAIYTIGVTIATLGVWGALLRSDTAALDATGHGDAGGSLAVMHLVLHSPPFYACAAWMFLHGLSQIGMVSWIGQLYALRHGINAEQAAYFISGNAAGFLVGRTVLGWISARRALPELLLLAACATCSSLIFWAALMDNSFVLGAVLFAVAGIATSGNAPSVQSYLASEMTIHSATAFALLTGVDHLGCALGPYIIGLVGTLFGLEAGIRYIPVAMLVLGTSAFVWWLRTGRNRTLALARESFAAEAQIS